MDNLSSRRGDRNRYPIVVLHDTSTAMMHFFTRLLAVICLIIVGAVAQRTWAMGGGAPTALHQILAQADVVAVATVSATDQARGGTYINATLQVERVVHGTIEDKRILVENDDPNACMGPPAKYVAGERVLVFLNHHKTNRYTTCGYSYGARVLSDKPLEACIQRIQEFYRIRIIKDDDQRKKHWAEWAVRCAEETSTRRDALSLLCRGTHGELNTKPMPNERTRYYPVLDELQRHRLLETLKLTPTDQNGRQDGCSLMRVIAFSFQDQALLRIARATTELVRSSDVKNANHAFATKFDSLRSDFVTRYNDLEHRRTQELLLKFGIQNGG